MDRGRLSGDMWFKIYYIWLGRKKGWAQTACIEGSKTLYGTRGTACAVHQQPIAAVYDTSAQACDMHPRVTQRDIYNVQQTAARVVYQYFVRVVRGDAYNTATARVSYRLVGMSVLNPRYTMRRVQHTAAALPVRATPPFSTEGAFTGVPGTYYTRASQQSMYNAQPVSHDGPFFDTTAAAPVHTSSANNAQHSCHRNVKKVNDCCRRTVNC